MLSKETAITIPFSIIMYEFYFFGRTKYSKRSYAYLLLLPIIPTAFFFYKTGNFHYVQQLIKHSFAENYHYFLTQFNVMLTYIRLIFLPINQNMDYDYPIAKSALEFPVLAGFAVLIVIIFIAIRTFSKYRLISFAILWYFITISLESSILLQNDLIFEHRLYLPLVGYSLFLVSFGYYFFGKTRPKGVITCLVILVICYSGLTYNRNFVWADEIVFWGDVVCKSPQKARPYLNRGKAYFDKGEIDKAMSDYNKAICIDPEFAAAYMDRGCAYAGKGDYNKAILDYNKAIQINPNFAGAYYNLGIAYANEQDLDRAISSYNKAVIIDPDLFGAFYNCGNIYAIKGDYDHAVEKFNRAIQIDPAFCCTYSSRAIVYFAKGEYGKSWTDVNEAVKLGCKISPEFLGELKKASGAPGRD